jgi:hypothetical protein
MRINSNDIETTVRHNKQEIVKLKQKRGSCKQYFEFFLLFRKNTA